MEIERTRLDEVLDKFSMFGRYHLQFMLSAILGFTYSSCSDHNYIFAAEEIKYRCIDEAFINATCGVVNGKRCTDWIYDNPHSFVAEFQLACQEWKRTFVGTAHVIGYMMGLFTIGPISDKIGRKKSIIWTGVSSAAFGVAKSFSRSYWLYVTLEFLGNVFGNIYSPFYVLNLEIVSARKRVIFHYLCNIGTFIGGVVLPLTAWGVSYWRNFLRVIFSPAFLFFTYFFFIDESPRWLLANGKKDKTIAIVKKMAYKNKIHLKEEALERLYIEDEDKHIKFVSLLKITFQSRTLLKRCAVCIVWWTTSAFVYHGMLINTVFLQGNKYVNYGVTQLVHFLGRFIIMFVLHKYKRKIPLICSFFAAALLCFVQPYLPSELAWLSVSVYMASSLMSTFFFDITYIYTSELFPTYTRNSLHAMCSAIGRIGGLAAPLTPLLLTYWSGLPMLVFGAASLTAGLVTFLVPDTADDALPDTVREAEDIGRKKTRDMIGINNLGLTQE